MTAVEWLIAELQRLPLEHRLEKAHLFYHAKQMEREQRIKDYNMGYTDAQCNHINDAENYVSEQEYLNCEYSGLPSVKFYEDIGLELLEKSSEELKKDIERIREEIRNIEDISNNPE